jgi:hypothetical protein
LLKNPEFVIPNPPEAGEVRYGFASHVFCAMSLSFLGILIEEGFLASLGMTAKRIFQQPVRSTGAGRHAFLPGFRLCFSAPPKRDAAPPQYNVPWHRRRLCAHFPFRVTFF